MILASYRMYHAQCTHTHDGPAAFPYMPCPHGPVPHSAPHPRRAQPHPTHQHMPHVFAGPAEAAEAHAGTQQALAAPHVAGYHLHLAHLHGLHVEHLQLHGLLHVGLQQGLQCVILLVLQGQEADSKASPNPQPGPSDKSGSEMGQGLGGQLPRQGLVRDELGQWLSPGTQARPRSAAKVTPITPKQCQTCLPRPRKHNKVRKELPDCRAL